MSTRTAFWLRPHEQRIHELHGALHDLAERLYEILYEMAAIDSLLPQWCRAATNQLELPLWRLDDDGGER